MPRSTEVTCPACRNSFALTAAIEQPIVDRLQAQFAEQAAKQDAALRAREQSLNDKLEELKQSQAQVDSLVASKLNQQRKQLAAELAVQATQAVRVQMEELKQTVALKDRKLEEAEKAELVIRKQKIEWETEKRAFDLQLARQLDEAKQNITKDKDEEFRLREAEKNKQLEDLRKQIDEAASKGGSRFAAGPGRSARARSGILAAPMFYRRRNPSCP